MQWLIYTLKNIPDLSLAKYQSLEEDGVEGAIKKCEAFLRQWQKISATYQMGINLWIKYDPDCNIGEKISIFIGISYFDIELTEKIKALMSDSLLTEYFTLKYFGDKMNCKYYKYKVTLKKCERKRECFKNDGKETIPLYYAQTWKTDPDARIISLLKSMHSLNNEAVYCISLAGVDSYEKTFKSLERPIEYLRNITHSRGAQEIVLKKDEFSRNAPKDIAAEETLKIYEDFLKNASASPCYQCNISVLSNDKIVADMLLNTVCGEVITEGDWSIYSHFNKNEFSIFDEFCFCNEILPDSLSYWPTYFTLDEISPFFRLPALYEGEHIEIKKETEPSETSGQIFLGKNLNGNSVTLAQNILKKHAFVCGVPGAGKTNTMLHLCYLLWKTCGIPFLVLEPAKKEYRALSKTNIDELIVFSPASGSKFPLAINPFEFPHGLSLSEHIQNLMDVFEGAFPLTPPLPALLDRSIEGIYLSHGWDTDDVNDGTKEYPTMSELYNRLEYELEHTDYDGEVRGNMKSALEMRIGSLLRRDLGNVFDVALSTLSPEDILKYPIIIEMESLGTGPSNFLTLMLCTLIREVLRADPFKDSEKEIRHVVFIEEAHNLIASKTDDVAADEGNPKIAATNFIVKMLAEVRALREGIIIADQLPTAMTPEVLKNTSLKIVHRLTSQDDRGLIGSTMSANDFQLEELASYMPGNALITYEGLLRPFRMQIAAFEEKDAPTDTDLYTLMKVRKKQIEVSETTFALRLDKIKQKWVNEWDIMMIVYQQLVADCKKLQQLSDFNDIKTVVEDIVKDELGLDKSLNILKQIKNKYSYVLNLSMKTDNEDILFFNKMESGINNVINNAKILIKKANVAERWK